MSPRFDLYFFTLDGHIHHLNQVWPPLPRSRYSHYAANQPPLSSLPRAKSTRRLSSSQYETGHTPLINNNLYPNNPLKLIFYNHL